MSTERTRSVNALTALLRTQVWGLDARKALSGKKIIGVSRWRAREEEPSLTIARAEAVGLAKRVLELDDQLKANEKQLTELVEISEAAPLLQETGFGPVTATACLTTWSHHGRVRNEAAYASLVGVNPLPASSGNTVRRRLNRGGDRSLNRALHMVALTKIAHDPETRKYVEKRRARSGHD